MHEFLIRRTDGEWFDLHIDRYPDLFLRDDTTDRRVDGPGDFRFQRSGVEVEVNYEDSGFHILIESGIDSSEAEQWVQEYLNRLCDLTYQKGSILQL